MDPPWIDGPPEWNDYTLPRELNRNAQQRRTDRREMKRFAHIAYQKYARMMDAKLYKQMYQAVFLPDRDCPKGTP